MLRKLAILLLISVFVIPQITSCSSAKDYAERRNLMMPKKSEVPANSRYKEPGKRKTNNYKPVSHSKKKSYF